MLRKIIKDTIITYRHKKWVKILRGGVENTNFTIVSNNCSAGFIYHDLGIKFQTPTINLFFSPEDYLEFIENLRYYKECELVELENSNRDYPVGVLKAKDTKHKDIIVYFQHYLNFYDAKSKWIERYNRINWDNLYFIFEFYDTLYNNELMYKFDALNLKNKVMLVHKKELCFKNSFYISCYDNDYPIAKIFEINYKTGKRYLDEFDYVGFLNGKGIRENRSKK